MINFQTEPSAVLVEKGNTNIDNIHHKVNKVHQPP